MIFSKFKKILAYKVHKIIEEADKNMQFCYFFFFFFSKRGKKSLASTALLQEMLNMDIISDAIVGPDH